MWTSSYVVLLTSDNYLVFGQPLSQVRDVPVKIECIGGSASHDEFVAGPRLGAKRFLTKIAYREFKEEMKASMVLREGVLEAAFDAGCTVDIKFDGKPVGKMQAFLLRTSKTSAELTAAFDLGPAPNEIASLQFVALDCAGLCVGLRSRLAEDEVDPTVVDLGVRLVSVKAEARRAFDAMSARMVHAGLNMGDVASLFFHLEGEEDSVELLTPRM